MKEDLHPATALHKKITQSSHKENTDSGKQTTDEKLRQLTEMKKWDKVKKII